MTRQSMGLAIALRDDAGARNNFLACYGAAVGIGWDRVYGSCTFIWARHASASAANGHATAAAGYASAASAGMRT